MRTGKIYITLVSLLILTRSLGQTDTFTFSIKSIEKEAQRLINKPEYKAWQSKEDTIYKYYRIGASRGMHVYPDAPSFETIHWYDDPSNGLNASLAYYYLRIKKNQTDRALVKGYLNAIVVSPDTLNRQQLIFYFASEKNRPKALSDFGYPWWWGMISASATSYWVNQYVADHLNEDTQESDFTWYLVKGRPDVLTNRNKEKAYDHLKTLFYKAPYNGDGETYWDLFFKLSPGRAVEDIISFWSEDESANFYITLVLLNHKPFISGNPQAARFFQNILDTTDTFGGLGDRYFIPALNTIIFCLDLPSGVHWLKSKLNEMSQGQPFDPEKHYQSFHSVLWLLVQNLDYRDYHWMSHIVLSKDHIPDSIRFSFLSKLYKDALGYFKKVVLDLKNASARDNLTDPAYDYAIRLLEDDVRHKNEILNDIR